MSGGTPGTNSDAIIILCTIVHLLSRSQIPGFDSVLDPRGIWVSDFLFSSIVQIREAIIGKVALGVPQGLRIQPM